MAAEFYRIVRVRPNGTEQIIKDIPFDDLTEDQIARAQIYAEGRQALRNNHIRLYSSNGGVVTPDDVIFDSGIQDGSALA
jgi:hypothetical protein